MNNFDNGEADRVCLRGYQTDSNRERMLYFRVELLEDETDLFECVSWESF